MCNRIALLVLCAWVFLAPLPFGSVPGIRGPDGAPAPGFLGSGGGYALFLAAAWLALALVLPSLLASPGTPVAAGRATRWMLGLLLALPALALLQCVPLPLHVHRLLAPAHAADLEVLLPERSWAPVSVAPGLTARAAVFLSALAVAALATLRAARSPRRAGAVLAALAASAATMTAADLLWPGSPFRLLSAAPLGDVGVTGTFIYRGNYAAFAAAGLGIAAGGLAHAFRSGRPLLAAGGAIAAGLCAAGLVSGGSRAGLAAGALAAAVGLSAWSRSRAVRAAVVALAVLGVLAGALFLPSLRGRFAYLSERPAHGFLDIRVPVWQSSLALAAGRPVLGAGLGAFARAIHLTQSDRVPEEIWFAHCDPLNLLAEGGAPALAAGLGLAAAGIALAVRGARRAAGGPSGVGTACAGGLAGLLAMALVDFPLQIPATALAAVVLLFLTPAASAGPVADRPVGRLRVPAGALAAVLGVALLALAWRGHVTAVERGGALTEGEAAAARGTVAYEARRYDEAVALLSRARALEPFEAQARYVLALALNRAGDPEGARRELGCAWRTARGRAELLWRIGYAAWKKRLAFAAACFREAGALHPWYVSRTYAELDPDIIPAAIPRRADALDGLAVWHAGRGEFEKAVEAYFSAHALAPTPERRRAVADLYRRVGRVEEGRQRFAQEGLSWPGE